MDDIYRNTDVIQLTDVDFIFKNEGIPQLNNELFRNNDGYIMFYANWCSNCREKVAFWSHLAKELNHTHVPFRIGVINVDNPSTMKIAQSLNIDFIPRIFHVNVDGQLSNYNGDSYEPTVILGEVCHQKNKLCRLYKSYFK
jgi:thiol-disulfide isomerase/thioredoxin